MEGEQLRVIHCKGLRKEEIEDRIRKDYRRSRKI
jgi:hypothetical protein